MSISTAPQFKHFQVPERLLMGPGPSNISTSVEKALGQPLIGHLDPQFLVLMNEVQEMLQYAFQTKNKLTIPVSGTGSAGMEAIFANLVEPGDKVLVCQNGLFSGRMVEMIEKLGGNVATIQKPWGEVFSKEEIAKKMDEEKPQFLALVHAETSTGAQQPMDGIGEIAASHGALMIMDCVTSLAGTPVKIDEWGVDAAYSGTQKCLSVPPGLSPITISERASKKIADRKSKIPTWYLDLSKVASYWGSERAYHHTAPISMNYALHEGLREVCEEGLENRWHRHMENHLYLAERLGKMGFKFVAAKENRLPQLNAVYIPEQYNDAAVRSRLLEDFQIEIGGGLGEFKGKVWRIGLMGETSKKENVDRLIEALNSCLA